MEREFNEIFSEIYFNFLISLINRYPDNRDSAVFQVSNEAMKGNEVIKLMEEKFKISIAQDSRTQKDISS